MADPAQRTPERTASGWQVVPSTCWALADDGLAVVLPLQSGVPLRLSASGTVVWEALVRGSSPEEAVAEIARSPVTTAEVAAAAAAAVGARPDALADDVAAFCATLAAAGVIRPAGPPARTPR